MKYTWLIILFVFFTGLISSCKHDSLIDDIDQMMPDTTLNPPDTTGNPGDTSGTPCNPGTVYFELDVLPLLVSNCALSGCHDPVTAESGVVLTSYEQVINTGDVEAFNLDDSKLFSVIVENDLDDRMPPVPNLPLSSDQISVIATWILQGATNETCDPDSGACDTMNVKFSTRVDPILATYCKGCHSGGTPSGGVSLDSYNGVKAVADDGRLVGAITWATGFQPMPDGGPQLPSCEIDQITSWVQAGAPNN